MGISSEWVKILREEFASCFLSEIPEGVEISVIIDDFSLSMYQLVNGVETGQGLKAKCHARLKQFWTGSLRRYIVLFDESDYVPASKYPTQKKRIEASKDIPFSEEEIKVYEIKITEGRLPDIPRLMATPTLRRELYCVCAKFLSYTQYPIMKEKEEKQRVTLIIDGPLQSTPNNSKVGNICTLIPAKVKPVYIDITPPSGIGESDLKVAKYLTQNKGESIFIRCYDSDMIPIILLNMRDLVNGVSIDTKVFLDLTCPTNAYKSGQYVRTIIDMVALWREITNLFKCEGQCRITSPIEVMCLLIVLSKTDFAEGFKGIGPKTVWKSFKAHGFREFGERQTVSMPMTLYGDSTQTRRLIVAEHELLDFITKRCGKRAQGIEYGKGIATIRRIFWNIDYWINGHKCTHFNPLEIHPNEYIPIYGWMVDHRGEVVRSDTVYICPTKPTQ